MIDRILSTPTYFDELVLTLLLRSPSPQNKSVNRSLSFFSPTAIFFDFVWIKDDI